MKKYCLQLGIEQIGTEKKKTYYIPESVIGSYMGVIAAGAKQDVKDIDFLDPDHTGKRVNTFLIALTSAAPNMRIYMNMDEIRQIFDLDDGVFNIYFKRAECPDKKKKRSH